MVFKHSGKKCIDKAHGFEVQALSVTQIYLLSGKKKKKLADMTAIKENRK